MCVIVVKPKGVRMPSDEIIRACARANRDGFGFCTPDSYFKSTSFIAFQDKLAAVRTDEPCIMHFRLATHGSVCQANCHPFKKKDVYFAHNGILDITPLRGKTDSETAFLKLIYPKIEKYGMFSEEVMTAIRGIIGSSKFAIMQGEDLGLYGHFEHAEGCYFSNLRFLYYM